VTTVEAAMGYNSGSGSNAIVLSVNDDNNGLPGDAIETFQVQNVPAAGSCCTLATATRHCHEQHWHTGYPGSPVLAGGEYRFTGCRLLRCLGIQYHRHEVLSVGGRSRYGLADAERSASGVRCVRKVKEHRVSHLLGAN
jgi:hypothetical protein